MIYLTFDSDGSAKIHFGSSRSAPVAVSKVDEKTQIRISRYPLEKGQPSSRVAQYDDKGRAGTAVVLEPMTLKMLMAGADKKSPASKGG